MIDPEAPIADVSEAHLARLIDAQVGGPKKRTLIAGLAFNVAVLLSILLSTLLTQASVSNVIAKISRTQDYVVGCNTPGPNAPPLTGHKCFDDTQGRVGGFITTIDKVTVAANECGRRVHGETTDQQFEDCVKGKLSVGVP